MFGWFPAENINLTLQHYSVLQEINLQKLSRFTLPTALMLIKFASCASMFLAYSKYRFTCETARLLNINNVYITWQALNYINYIKREKK